MSVFDCFLKKAQANLISRDAFQRYMDIMQAKQDELGRAYGASEAARRAAIETVDEQTNALAVKADQMVRQLEAQRNILQRVQDVRTGVQELRDTAGDFGFGNKAPPTLSKDFQTPVTTALRSLIDRDFWHIGKGVNVQYLTKDIYGKAHSMFTEALDYLQPRLLGLKNDPARDFDVLDAAFGKTDVTPEARRIAESWHTKVDAFLVKEFNDAGGNLPARKGYVPNPALDRTKVASFNVSDWITDMRRLVDRAQTFDRDTGKPVTDARFDALFTQIYESAVRNWADDAPSSAFGVGLKLANSRTMERVIHLKDAASWREYAQKYGSHDSVWESMTAHIQNMSQDIALMRVFGPDIKAAERYALSLFDNEYGVLTRSAEAGDDKGALEAFKFNRKAENSINRGRKHVRDLFNQVSGDVNAPVDLTLARRAADVRSWLRASQLGSAIISALTDQGTMLMTTRMNDLPYTNIIKEAVSLMAKGGGDLTAQQMGIAADSLIRSSQAADRFMGETIRTGKVAQIADATMRASGLRAWTAANRNAFALEYMAKLANDSAKPFEQLSEVTKEAFARYDISPREWDIARAVDKHLPDDNAPFLRPIDIRDVDRGVGEKFSQLINSEMDKAVIDGSSPTVRALMTGDSRPGTIWGEARRSIAAYKGFPITIALTQGALAMSRGWDGTRLGHAALTLVTMWGLGMISFQAKQIVMGKDPVDMDPTSEVGQKAWFAALMQSGGLSLFGDLLNQDKTRFGNSYASLIAGPVATLGEDVLGRFLFANMQRLVKGEETQFAGDALYLGARYAGPASSLWYARTAFQRGIVDQMSLLIDPKAPERFRRMEKLAQDNWGQDFWYRPGQATPSRAPDLSILGGQ